MTEAEFTTSVIEAARLLKWRCAHFRPAQTKNGWRTPVQGDGKGWPDLILLHPTWGLLVRELKVGSGRLTPEQAAWLQAWQAIGISAEVWKPEDWPRIERELMGVFDA